MAKEKQILNRLKEVLQEQRRSQTWLAKQLGLAYGTVNAWVNNRGQPYLTDLIRVAELLEVAPADLIVDGRKKERPMANHRPLVEFGINL